MLDSLHHVWECPLCGRRVPANIDTCRCGLGRDRLGRDRDEPPGRDAGATRIASTAPKAARTLIVAVAALVLAATGATALMVLISKRAAPTAATSQTIRVLSRLDDFTRNAGPKTRNTIPAFLAISGRLGVLGEHPDDPTSAQAIKQISEVELAKGVCTAERCGPHSAFVSWRLRQLAGCQTRTDCFGEAP